jgi:predicted small metal-binding protein
VPAENVSDNDNIPDDDVPDDIPDDDMPDDILDDVADDIPQDMQDDILDDVADHIPQDMQDHTVDNIPEDISNDISDRMSVESEGEKASDSVFVDVANEGDTSYRASKASKVDNTLDGRCAVQPSVGSPLLINIVASRIPASFFDLGCPGQSFSVQLYKTLGSAIFAKKYIPDIYTSRPF